MKIDYEKLIDIVDGTTILKEVEAVLTEVAHHFVDITKVEERVYGSLIRAKESGRVKNITPNLARRTALRESSELLSRGRYTDVEQTRFGELDSEGEDGSYVSFEPIDYEASDGVDVLELDEIVDTLAPKEDKRRRLILQEWTSGTTNDRDIARLLVDELGGKEKTHSIFISRFKKECRELLGGEFGYGL